MKSGKSKDYIPERGDIVWLEFDPRTGREHSGLRPAIVLSPKEYNNKAGLAIFCPVTSKIKGYPFEVAVKIHNKIQGVILTDQIKSLDWRIRKAEFIVKSGDIILNKVIDKISLLIYSNDDNKS